MNADILYNMWIVVRIITNYNGAGEKIAHVLVQKVQTAVALSVICVQ